MRPSATGRARDARYMLNFHFSQLRFFLHLAFHIAPTLKHLPYRMISHFHFSHFYFSQPRVISSWAEAFDCEPAQQWPTYMDGVSLFTFVIIIVIIIMIINIIIVTIINIIIVTIINPGQISSNASYSCIKNIIIR